MTGAKNLGAGKGTRKSGPGKPSRYRTRKTMTPVERVERARHIAALRAQARPLSWRAIGERLGIDERTCRLIYDDFLTWPQNTGDAERLVDDTLALIQAQIRELDDTIRDARDQGNHAARVGAIRLQMDALAARWDVMEKAGRLPRDWTRFRAGEEAHLLMREFMLVLRGRLEDELLEELDRIVSRAAGPAGVIEEADVVA